MNDLLGHLTDDHPERDFSLELSRCNDRILQLYHAWLHDMLNPDHEHEVEEA